MQYEKEQKEELDQKMQDKKEEPDSAGAEVQPLDEDENDESVSSLLYIHCIYIKEFFLWPASGR